MPEERGIMPEVGVMDYITKAVLVFFGGCVGIYMAYSSFENTIKKQFNSGYYVLDGKAYKVIEIK